MEVRQKLKIGEKCTKRRRKEYVSRKGVGRSGNKGRRKDAIEGGKRGEDR
jgi:hypothetical protein